MPYYLSIAFVLLSFAAARIPYAGAPRAVPASDAKRAWANEDLERLSKVSGLISVVGQPTSEALQGVEAPAPKSGVKDPAWYAEEASSLNARLEAEQADLRDFTQALDDVRELKSTTGGVNLAEDDIGITPKATIDILQNRVTETQTELDELEDLARRNGIPPGVLRGPWQGGAAEKAVTAAEQSKYDESTPEGDL
jgi:hypothetical protein